MKLPTTPKARTSLFSRIFLRLIVLFFLLGTFVSAIQLANQIQTLNEIYRIESQWAFSNVYKQLSEIVKNPESLRDLHATLEAKQTEWKSLYHAADLGIFDILERTPLLREDTPWTAEDSRAIEKTYKAQKTNTPYHIVLRDKPRQLAAYFLFNGPENKIYAARILFPLANIHQALARSYGSLGLMLFLILIAVLSIGNSLARSIVKPIQALNQATREIMSGHLGKHVHIDTGDEIEVLAGTFNEMSDTLRAMKSKAEDANPLTGLQGNKAIFGELQKRIHERQKFVVFHVDLDRFKIFNDHYGLAKGDLAIKKTAEILKKVVLEKGSPDDFFGHQGGDDFVVMTRPNRAALLGAEICKQFDDDAVRALYNKEDLSRGYTLHLDRRRQAETGEEVMRNFPLLSISLAGVSTAQKDYADYFECMNVLSEVKKEVKQIIKSAWLIRE